MRGPLRAAFLTVVIAASAAPMAHAEPHLVIVATGTGTLPVDKIATALRAELPDLVFTIGGVDDPRPGVAGARFVRWADGRVAVGFRDPFGREDARIVAPGPEPAAAIAHAFVELRASLLAEPAAEPEPEDEEPIDEDALETNPYVEAPEPRHRRARGEVRSNAHPRLELPAGHAIVALGFGNFATADHAAAANPYASFGVDLALFPGRLDGLEGPGAWLGLQVDAHRRDGGLTYSNTQLDAALVVEWPIRFRSLRWARLRGGWRTLRQDVDLDNDPFDDAMRDVVYQGPLFGADAGLLLSPDTVLSVGLALHPIGNVSAPSVASSDEDRQDGLGWTVRLGVANRMGTPVDWSFDVELVHYGVDVGDAGRLAQTNLQGVLGVGYSLR